MAARVFISYRHSDSKALTDRLVEHLSERLGPGNVFRDVGSIEPGDDFTEVLAESLDHCDTALVLIGESWFEAEDEHGARRLENPEDWVRREILAVLERDIRVIPVLLDDTKMPRERDFPAPLRPLARRQAVKLRPDPDFETDLERLLRRVPGVNPPVFRRNLTLLVLILALVAFWALRYSNWSGSVLAAVVGSCAVLLGALFKILPDHRIRAIKGGIEERIFLNPRASVALGSCLPLTALGFSFFGGVCITTPADSPSLSVSISDTDEPGEYSLLDPGEWREVFWTLPWSPRRLTVFVQHMPEVRLELSSWERETLTVPGDFVRPAVLVYCDSLFLADSAKHPPSGHVLRCSVTVGGERLEEIDYEGQSFYVGCGQEVGLPPVVHSVWDGVLAGRALDEPSRNNLNSVWTTLGPGFGAVKLLNGQSLMVEIRNYADPESSVFTTVGRAETLIKDPAQSGSFPQMLPLKIL